MSATNRIKGGAKRLLWQLGYSMHSIGLPDDPNRELLGPLGPELVAHRVMTRAVLQTKRVNCVVDVGANVGAYGRHLREIGYRGDIISFEPAARSFDQLAAAAQGDPSWHAYRLALGASAGRLHLQVAQDSVFTSFLRPNPFSLDRFGRHGSGVEHEEEVDVQRLDAVLDELVGHVEDRRILLKADTQGWDLDVIEGARGCLDRIVGLQVELSVQPIYEGQISWLDGLRTLRDMGFKPVHMCTVNRDGALGVVEMDCLLVVAGSL